VVACGLLPMRRGRACGNWLDRDWQAAQVAGWLLSPELKDAVTEAFPRAGMPAAASPLAGAGR